MKNKFALLAAFVLSAPATFAQSVTPPSVEEHLKLATAAAKADLLGPLGLCKTATPDPVVGFKENYDKMNQEPPLEPMQVMDDLYFLGNYWTSAWALKTSGGLVIIDSLDNSDEAKQYIEDGLRKLKLDPGRHQICHRQPRPWRPLRRRAISKGQIPSAHRDERDRLESTRGSGIRSQAQPMFGDPPKRDMAVKDGDTIKLGKTTLKLYVIPGHTLGTLATVFDVHDHGKVHRAVAWGGTAYNFGPLPDRLQIYADTTVKYRDIMKKENTDIFLSNHVSYDAAVAKMATLRERKPSESNPFVVGQDAVQRSDRARRMRAGDQGLCRGGSARETRRSAVIMTVMIPALTNTVTTAVVVWRRSSNSL